MHRLRCRSLFVPATPIWLGLLLAVTLPACKSKESSPNAASASAKLTGASATSASATGTGSPGEKSDGCTNCVLRSSQVREDPEAGKRDWEKLRAHQIQREKERPLRWDHRHMKEHEAVLAAIAQARARYDSASTASAIASTQKSMGSTLADIRRQVHEIDPWHNGSALLDDYEAIVQILEKRYPPALRASLKGKKGELAAVRADLDARLKKVREWLKKAAAHEDDEE